jgi:hypothetical protein
MTAFTAVDASLEGLRVIRREPKAVVYWIGVWAMAFALIAAIRLFTGALGASPASDDAGVLRRFGPLAVILAPTVLVLWIMTTATVYRAVLRPGEHGWHLFKLGPDEARIAILSALETALLALLGGAPAYLLLVLLNPIFEMAPGLNRVTAIVGFVATVAIEFWIAVRFSLAPVQTFAERSFPFAGFWSFTRGHFWRLLGAYLIVVVQIVGLLAVSLVVGLAFSPLAETVVQWKDPTLVRRLVLWLLVALLAVLTAILWVVPLILICACQAMAYREIVEDSRPTTA